MTTFYGTYGSEPMLASVAQHLDRIPNDLDVHTITLVLNGRHGEFDLVVEATDDDLEDVRYEGVAHRSGGVAGWRRVDADRRGLTAADIRADLDRVAQDVTTTYSIAKAYGPRGPVGWDLFQDGEWAQRFRLLRDAKAAKRELETTAAALRTAADGMTKEGSP